MRIHSHNRVWFLTLIATAALMAGWPQYGRGGAAGAGQSAASHARPAEGTPASSPAQQAAGNPARAAGAVPASSPVPPFPVLPFNIEYGYAKKYFVERINDDKYYLGIEAMLQEGASAVNEVTLTEREGRRKVYYTNSEARAKFLAGLGKPAHVTPIDYRVEESLGEQPKHIISLKDEKGTPIRWMFIQAYDLDEESKGVSLIGRPFRVMHRVMASMAGEGTSVQIGDAIDKAKERLDLSTLPDHIVYEGTFCVDATVGTLVAGSQAWQVRTAPPSLEVGAEWVFAAENGNRRLAVTAKRGDELTLREVVGDFPLAAPMTLIMKQTPEGLALKSVTFSEGKQVLRWSFAPELNIAATWQSGKKGSVSFQVDMGGDDVVIKGILEAERKGDMVELIGHPSSPEWANAVILKSQIIFTGSGYTVNVEKPPTTN
jgi:hypothetical protein